MIQKNNVIEITTGTILKVFLVALALVGLFFIRDIVFVIMFSIVVASAVAPAARWFEEKRIPRTISVLFIYIIMFSVLGFIFYLVVPTFISEVSSFASNLPKYFENPAYFKDLFGFLPISDGSFGNILQDVFVQLQERVSSFATGFFQATASVFGGAMSFFMIIIISFYLSVQRDGLGSFLRIITPTQYEDYVLNLWERSRKKIGRWLQGQILLGVLVGVLVFLGLTILGVEYALIFALLAAVFELIPIFGPILASVPPIIMTFMHDPSLGIMVAALYIIIQQFENHLIYPLVVRKIVGLPPIIVIISIIVGGQLGGFFGILLAIPLATVLMEFLNDVAEKKYTALKKK
ncbi:MAG: AI-2E family transporter [Candidatus Marinimicrobia bacterium]|nr:AI-2E family transporter [Candidatus Neomarinimicrobiota bacterium]